MGGTSEPWSSGACGLLPPGELLRPRDGIVLLADGGDLRLDRAGMLLEERRLRIFGGGDLGMLTLAVDVDDEATAYEILRAVPEFKDLIVVREEDVPK